MDRQQSLTQVRIASLVFLFLVVASNAGPETRLAQGGDFIANAANHSSAKGSIDPLADDAALNDLARLTPQTLCVVGDRGTIWLVDEKQAPALVHYDPTVAWKSIQVLNGQVAYVAGARFQPHTGVGSGVLAKTIDGGKTWQPVAIGLVPPLSYVRFFDNERGVLAGHASEQAPAGVLRTTDGGKTWVPVAGAKEDGCTTAVFLDFEMGLVAGPSGGPSLVGDGQLLPGRMPGLSRRSIRNLSLDLDDRGWLVGDKGLVLQTSTGGVVWDGPPQEIAEETRSFVNLQAVAHRGDHVYLAGSPGTKIWVSHNGGASWTAFSTGISSPLRQLKLIDDRLGYAVGDLGVILKTTDAGETWKPIKNGTYRSAALQVVAKSQDVAALMTAKLGLAQGYRLATHCVLRDQTSQPLRDAELDAALMAAGGAGLGMGSQLPIDLPRIELERKSLEVVWQRASEGRLGESLVGPLVRDIRQWKPRVVILAPSSGSSAIDELVAATIEQAITQAADATQWLELHQQLGLDPWKVDRVFVRQPSGSLGSVSISPYDAAGQQGMPVGQLAAACHALLHNEQRLPMESFRIDERLTPANFVPKATQDFFVGLGIAAGSAGRRRPFNEQEAASDQLALMREQRTIAGYLEHKKTDGSTGAELLAGMSPTLDKLSPAAGALLLTDVATQYYQRAAWEEYQATLLELVRRYPDEPVAQRAMGDLLRFLSSTEMAHWRLTQSPVLEVLSKPAKGGKTKRTPLYEKGEAGKRDLASLSQPKGGSEEESGFNGSMPKEGDQSQQIRDGWLSTAAGLSEQIQKHNSAYFQQPEIQLQIACLARQSGQHGFSDDILRRLGRLRRGVGAANAFERELWLMEPGFDRPQQLVGVKSTRQKPLLDGVLSDDCWQSAAEVQLVPVGSQRTDASAPGVVMVIRDREFLYLAGRLTREPSQTIQQVKWAGRKHDEADPSEDTVVIELDLDRDYATTYTFEINCTGGLRDTCCGDARWNPQWFAACVADETDWRFEAAIPIAQLTLDVPNKGEAWGLAIERIVPGVRYDAWGASPSRQSTVNRLGLMRFE